MRVQPQAGMTAQGANERARHGAKSVSKWRGLGVVQKMVGLCAVPSGDEVDEPLQTRKEGCQRVWGMMKITENN